MKSSRKSSRKGTRLLTLSMLTVAPVAAMAWACSSSDEDGGGGAGRVQVDPGGTFGAEVSLTVVGRGRVVSDLPGLDCPTDCFSRIVFRDRNEKGAADGIKLKAIANTGKSRFAGWRFEPTPLGIRGAGPTECNPLVRNGATPPADPNALEITLPYGDTQGTPPRGLEGPCAGATTVPVAYSIVATFVDDGITDGGLDGDADGGPVGEVLYEAPVAGAQAREIGIVGSRLYWRFTSGGVAGIASGPTLATPGSMPTVLVPATGAIDRFEADTYVVIQKQGGELDVFNGGTSPTVLPSAPAACSAVTSDTSSVYCQSADTVVAWTTGGVGPTTLYSGLPQGADKFASDNTYLYFVDNSQGAGLSTIGRIIRTGNDGGVATLSTLLTSQTNPSRLRVTSSRTWWINVDVNASIGEGRTASTGSTISTVNATGQSGLRLLTIDPSSTSLAWLGVVSATNSQILRVGTSSASSTVFRQGIANLGGIAVDASYVYWTTSDGRVYRALKP